jgi:competence protein ComEA
VADHRTVSELSRSQLLVYGAIAVAVLLLGARWLRSADQAEAGFGAVAGSPDQPSIELDRGGEGIVVHVAGAVRDPGIYEFPAGSRVTDAVDRAGGAVGSAAPDAINLAAKLADGQQVVIPARAGSSAAVAVAAGAAVEDAPISLGTATVEQLDTIEGIGPVTAADIISFRDEHGGLSSVDELDQLSGIGPATMEALRDRLQP